MTAGSRRNGGEFWRVAAGELLGSPEKEEERTPGQQSRGNRLATKATSGLGHTGLAEGPASNGAGDSSDLVNPGRDSGGRSTRWQKERTERTQAG